MAIKFGIQAEPLARGGALIREVFEGEKKLSPHGDGRVVSQALGHVDDDIKKQHPKEYAAFKELLEKGKDALIAAALAEVGRVIVPSAAALIEKVVAEVEEVVEEAIKPGKKKKAKAEAAVLDEEKKSDEVAQS